MRNRMNADNAMAGGGGSKSTAQVGLISMPWPRIDLVPIATAALKSYVQGKDPRIKVDCLHPYLDVANLFGIRHYSAIANKRLAGDMIYATLLYPEKRSQLRNLDRHIGHAAANEVRRLLPALGRLHRDFMSSRKLGHYRLFGISIGANQLLASLYLARQLKRLHPAVPIVIGGSCIPGRIGSSVLATFPEIDYFVNGEGERPFLGLCRHIIFNDHPADAIPGVCHNAVRDGHGKSGCDQLSDLSELPVPDYGDYFDHTKQLALGEKITPFLTVEGSRGCSWNRCTFCNFNAQWSGCRTKPARQFAAELRQISDQNRALNFYLSDTNVNMPARQDLFDAIQGLGRDFRFNLEIRAHTGASEAALLKKTGVFAVQVGIEALSDRVLRLIDKGTSVMDNAVIMKRLAIVGISLHGNLIVGLPGTVEDDVSETVNAIDWLDIYPPLNISHFSLTEASPLQNTARQRGLTDIKNDISYARLFPAAVLERLILPYQQFAEAGRYQRLWRRVIARTRRWSRDYTKARVRHGGKPLLGYRDGESFLLISRRLANGDTAPFVLTGASRAIYLCCQEPQTIEAVARAFPDIPATAIEQFLRSLFEKRLMFYSGGRYLSLAIKDVNAL